MVWIGLDWIGLMDGWMDERVGWVDWQLGGWACSDFYYVVCSIN